MTLICTILYHWPLWDLKNGMEKSSLTISFMYRPHHYRFEHQVSVQPSIELPFYRTMSASSLL